jgi:PleD family two-component response regulator
MDGVMIPSVLPRTRPSQGLWTRISRVSPPIGGSGAVYRSDLTVSIGASVGVASGIQPLIPSVLIHRADAALLEAKHAGRNMVMSAALG